MAAVVAVPVAIEVGAGIWGLFSAVGGALLVSLGIGAAQQIAGGGRQEIGADPSPESNPPGNSDYPGGTPGTEGGGGGGGGGGRTICPICGVHPFFCKCIRA